MAYDSAKGEIFGQYSSISGSEVVEVISDSTNKVVANITGGDAAGYIGDVVYDSGRGLVFAAYGNEHAGAYGSTPLISVISDSNNTGATISWNTPGNSQYNWPNQPSGMTYDSGKGEIFVSDASGGSVYVISDSSYAIVATISVEPSAGEMAYDSAKSEVFVANYEQVSVISDSTNEVVANISVSATSLAYDPAKGEVFAYNGNSISVISDSTNQVVSTISGITGGSSSIAYDSGKGEIFAGAVVSESTNSVVAQLPAGVGSIIYDSGRQEIVAASSTGLELFSDSSSPSSSTGSTTSSPSGVASTTSAASTSAASTPTSTSKSSSSSLSLAYLEAMAVVATVLISALAVSRGPRRSRT